MDEMRYSPENILAGCLLVNGNETVEQIQDIVNVKDFQNTQAQAVYEAALRLKISGKENNPVTIQDTAKDMGVILSNEYCANQMEISHFAGDIQELAHIIHDSAIEREASLIGQKLAYMDIKPLEAMAQLSEILQTQQSRLLTPMEAAQGAMDEIVKAAQGEGRQYLSTGYSLLDRQLSGGLVKCGLITVAARPGTGKTIVGLNLADNVAKKYGTVLYISLEMPYTQLWNRRAARTSGVDSAKIANGDLTPEEWKLVTEAFDLLSQRPFVIRDKPTTLGDIQSEARRIKDLAMIVIDHIGLIKTDRRKSSYENMKEISNGLKQLAMSLGIPIIALCQLNRQSEQKESKRPTMANLRDSGTIEEDSDVVCLLFRQAVYDAGNHAGDEIQDIDFIIDKDRFGPPGIVTLNYCAATSRIAEKAYGY